MFENVVFLKICEPKVTNFCPKFVVSSLDIEINLNVFETILVLWLIKRGNF